jgi:hypothetical protein
VAEGCPDEMRINGADALLLAVVDEARRGEK